MGEVNVDDWGQVVSPFLSLSDTGVQFCPSDRGLVEDIDWKAAITGEMMYHLCD